MSASQQAETQRARHGRRRRRPWSFITMDAIFALAAAPRARVLERAATRVPGCLYLCLWAPVTGQRPSSHLFCLDAWIGGGAGGDRARAMFEAYRGALCAVISGCVPGWAYKEGRTSMELPEPNLTAAASLQVQHQFYHEVGTKMAVFMGCESGEIEIGLSTSTMVAAVADHLRQSLLEELLHPPPTRPSSSSSSMPPLSVGSPEYSSFIIRSMATPPVVASAGEPSAQAPLPGLSTQYEFPSEQADVAAMAHAMLAVISSSSDPSTTCTPPPPPRPCSSWLARRRSSPSRSTAFKAYAAALSPRAPRARPGQRMIKTCIALLASAHAATRGRELVAAHGEEGAAQQQPPPTTASQLHHMISERRRRERLNDSFQSLRALLPPGSKKDKANVLASTTEYMSKLISQVTHLREKNLQLEAQLAGPNPYGDDDGSSSEKIEVDVATTGASTSTPSQQPREVSVRITVREECDMSDLLISLMTCLKETGSSTVVSVEARKQSTGVALAQASLTLRIPEAGDIVDLTRLKEALTKVVEDAMTPPPRRQPESP